MAKFTKEIKTVIENNTKEEAMRILGISKYTLNYYINYYCLSYKKVTHKFQSEKSKRILNEIEKGEMKDIQIARLCGVSRQYVSSIRKKYEKE